MTKTGDGPKKTVMMNEYRVNQTIFVYLYAENRDAAVEKADTIPRGEWDGYTDDYDIECLEEDVDVEEDAK